MAPATCTGREIEVAVRTASIGIRDGNPGDNQMPGVVRCRLFHGDFVQYVADCSTGQLIVHRPPTNLIEEGANVTLTFPPESCVLLEVSWRGWRCHPSTMADGSNPGPSCPDVAMTWMLRYRRE